MRSAFDPIERKAPAVAALGVLLLAAGPALASGCPDGRDWPRFLGPDLDGTSCEPLRTPWPADGLAVAWHAAVGEGYSAPTVVGDRVLVFDRVGDEARLVARSTTDGAELWTSTWASTYEDFYGYSGGPRTSPVVDGDRVFAFGVDGLLRCHDLASGELRWEVDTGARFGVVQNFFGVGSTPIVEGDLLITMVGGSPAGSPRIHSGEVEPNGTALVAFDTASGEVRWSAGDALASYASPVIVDVEGRRRGLAFVREGLLAFDPADGAIGGFFPWRAKKLESVNAATPVVVGDTVLITESYGPGGALLRWTDDGFTPVWTDPPRGKALESHWAIPIVRDGTIYASSGQSSGEAELRAIDHATGRVLWSEPGLGRSTLLGADGHLVVLTERGLLLLVEATPERFTPVSRTDLGEDAPADGPRLRYPVWNAPVLSRGLLYLRGKDRLVVLRAGPEPAAPGPAPERPSGAR